MLTGKSYKLSRSQCLCLVERKFHRFDGCQMSAFQKSIQVVVSKENASFRPVDHR